MLNVGGGELLIILLVALIFLGPTRLPEVARQMGQAAGSLKAMASGFQAELEAASKPAADPTMTLSGPTPQDEAIAATQVPAAESAPESGTEPQDLLAAARQTTYDDDDDGPPKSYGGPTDLSNPVMGAQPPVQEQEPGVADSDGTADDQTDLAFDGDEEE